MAKAPRPGVSTRADELEAAQTVMTLVVKRPITTESGRLIPERHAIAINNVPMRERIICRKATGLPLAAFWAEDRIDVDSIMVLWWMARRLNGEAALTFDQAAEQWPMDLSEDDLDIELDEPDDEDDSPEA